jgi:hypothetical protein
VVKAAYGFAFTWLLIEALKTTRTLRRICGFERISDIPSESTFSRAFAEFAKSGLGVRVHDALVEKCLKAALIGHISRDSTAIEGREKPVKNARKEKPAPRKRRRRAKGGQREPKEESMDEDEQMTSTPRAFRCPCWFKWNRDRAIIAQNQEHAGNRGHS